MGRLAQAARPNRSESSIVEWHALARDEHAAFFDYIAAHGQTVALALTGLNSWPARSSLARLAAGSYGPSLKDECAYAGEQRDDGDEAANPRNPSDERKR